MWPFQKLWEGFGECLGADSPVQCVLHDFARDCGQKRGKNEGSGIPNSRKQGPGFMENDKGKRHSKKYSSIPIADGEGFSQGFCKGH